MLNAIEVCIAANVPVSLIGDPGGGKSSFGRAIFDAIHGHLEVITLSSLLPEDLSYEPAISADGKYILQRPGWARRLCTLPEGVPGGLFIDELTTAPPALVAPALRITQERVVGNDLQLPESTRMLTAWNPTATSCGGHELSAPIANRFCHLRFNMISDEDWCAGLASGFLNMSNLRRNHLEIAINESRARALVQGFYKVHVGARQYDYKKYNADFPAFPTRRSWTMAARLLAACEVLPTSEDVAIQCLAGCVGEGIAYEFLGWSRKQDLGDPKEILANPDKFRVPDTADKIYVTLQAVVAEAIGDPSDKKAATLKKYWEAVWKIVAKVTAAGAADIAGLAARQLAKHQTSELTVDVVAKNILELAPLLRQAGLWGAK